MNPDSVVVRIERVAGNFPPKTRAAVVSIIAQETAKAIENAPPKSVPLTDEEIAVIRKSLKK